MPKGMLKAYNERQKRRRRRNDARVSQRMSETTITVTQVKSGISAKPKTRGTLRALGLGRIGKSNTLPDRPEIRGMIARVPHLVRVETRTPKEELIMHVHDLSPAPGSTKNAQARRPRHRRQGRQDRRPRHQGPARPQHGRPRLRGRPDAAQAAGARS